MGKITEFFAGMTTLEETISPINGKISVVKSIAFGTYIQVAGLTQSGGIIKNIWNKTLGKVSKISKLPEAPNVLILGLGGGSIVQVVKKYWPKAKITAVDIDPIMVKLGEKHLGLNKNEVNIVIEDAEMFLEKIKNNKNEKKFDLVLIDLYVGDEFPKKFETKSFLICTRNVLRYGGMVVLNRLYYGEKRPQAVKFGIVLEKIFPKVEVFYPEANIMFICKKT